MRDRPLLWSAAALAAGNPRHIWVISAAAFLIPLASASQDIAIDAYAVEVLRPEEQGVAAGARSAISRFALTLSGRLAITLATWVSWPVRRPAPSRIGGGSCSTPTSGRR